MEEISKTYHIESSIDKVWQALVNPIEIAKWGADPAEMSSDEGFEFSLWGGDVYGKNIEIEPKEKLVQEWFSGDMETPTMVTIELSEDDDGFVEVNLLHEGVSDEFRSEIEESWDKYYFGAIKEYLEGENEGLPNIDEMLSDSEENFDENNLEEI